MQSLPRQSSCSNVDWGPGGTGMNIADVFSTSLTGSEQGV